LSWRQKAEEKAEGRRLLSWRQKAEEKAEGRRLLSWRQKGYCLYSKLFNLFELVGYCRRAVVVFLMLNRLRSGNLGTQGSVLALASRPPYVKKYLNS
jgi:hypothetical protein